MEKWADYGILKARYTVNRTEIKDLRLTQDRGEQFGAEERWNRNQVIAAIERGKTFITLAMTPEGKLGKGLPVNIVTVNSMKYLRSDSEIKAADSLENLPEF